MSFPRTRAASPMRPGSPTKPDPRAGDRESAMTKHPHVPRRWLATGVAPRARRAVEVVSVAHEAF